MTQVKQDPKGTPPTSKATEPTKKAKAKKKKPNPHAASIRELERLYKDANKLANNARANADKIKSAIAELKKR